MRNFWATDSCIHKCTNPDSVNFLPSYWALYLNLPDFHMLLVLIPDIIPAKDRFPSVEMTEFLILLIMSLIKRKSPSALTPFRKSRVVRQLAAISAITLSVVFIPWVSGRCLQPHGERCGHLEDPAEDQSSWVTEQPDGEEWPPLGNIFIHKPPTVLLELSADWNRTLPCCSLNTELSVMITMLSRSFILMHQRSSSAWSINVTRNTLSSNRRNLENVWCSSPIHEKKNCLHHNNNYTTVLLSSCMRLLRSFYNSTVLRTVPAANHNTSLY